jgi:hypothetical protein
MIHKVKGVQNNMVLVSYEILQKALIISDLRLSPGEPKHIFSGWPELEQMFDDFSNSFSDRITVQDAVNFFRPNFQITFQ